MRIVCLVLLSAFLSGCMLSKKRTDKLTMRQVLKDTAGLRAAAEAAVTLTYGTPERSFAVRDVQDPALRSKLSGWGTRVRVAYKDTTYYEVPDSCVTFSFMEITGLMEIIYDFAAIGRHFRDSTGNKHQYYFVKLAPRIYYRRREIPMM